MIYATANMDPYIPINNLSTAHKHYKTHTNLCSSTKSTLETICNRQTAYDPQYIIRPSRNSCKTTAAGLAQVSLPVSGTAAVFSRQAEEGGCDTCGTLDNLSSNLANPFRPYCNGIINSTYREINGMTASTAAIKPWKTCKALLAD